MVHDICNPHISRSFLLEQAFQLKIIREVGSNVSMNNMSRLQEN